MVATLPGLSRYPRYHHQTTILTSAPRGPELIGCGSNRSRPQAHSPTSPHSWCSLVLVVSIGVGFLHDLLALCQLRVQCLNPRGQPASTILISFTILLFLCRSVLNLTRSCTTYCYHPDESRQRISKSCVSTRTTLSTTKHKAHDANS